jgi:GT2 family glycosyltransferase
MVELSLEIPTYNEAGNLPVLIERLEGLDLDLEIIIIDDNSPDGTYGDLFASDLLQARTVIWQSDLVPVLDPFDCW